jgi:hypothetical protein
MAAAPEPWEFALLALASYRLWRLAAEDSILDRPRDRLPHNVAEFVECPWCLGFWISAASYASWRAAPRATLAAASPLAISAVVGALSHALES